MILVLRVLSGARAGHVFTADAAAIRIGRAASADLQFAPDSDRFVSAEHATITRVATSFVLRDAGSRNGTFVNGRRVGEAELRDFDRVVFGVGGPEVEVRIVGADHLHEINANVERQQYAGRPRARPAIPKPWDRRAFTLLLLLSLATAVVFAWQRRERLEWERERDAMRTRIDSLMTDGERAISLLQGNMQELASALRTSQQQVQHAVTAFELAVRQGRSDSLPVLRERLDGALATLSQQQAVASIDHATIRQRHEHAVARIFVESENGVVSTGTAFAVRTDATLVTARHILVTDSSPVRRIAVQFSHSDQVWAARVIALDTESDLAAIKVDDIIGEVPAVSMFNLETDTLGSRAPVVLIGYPLGGESRSSDRPGRTVIRAIVSVGMAMSLDRELIELQAYGAPGTSGSPVFDSSGALMAVAFGGRNDAGLHYVLAAPAAAVERLIAGISRQ